VTDVLVARAVPRGQASYQHTAGISATTGATWRRRDVLSNLDNPRRSIERKGRPRKRGGRSGRVGAQEPFVFQVALPEERGVEGKTIRSYERVKLV